jgi:alginate O-acetyltransferase complex protein AlgI
MSLLQIIVLLIIAILLGQLRKGRAIPLMAFSAFVIYWLQPVQSPINLTFWLPTLTLVLIVFIWRFLFSDDNPGWRENNLALVVLSIVVILMGANRYFHLEQVFITETPRWYIVGFTVAVMLAPTLPIFRLQKKRSSIYAVAIAGLIALLVFIKLPSLQTTFFEYISVLRGKESPVGWVSLSWLGFSYIVFRLMHTIIDKKAGRLRFVTLAEYVNYVIFFPAVVAGPIDRFERFTRDLNTPVVLDRQGWLDAGTRFFLGLFKKFVLADGLAWIALNETFARDINSTAGLWLLLYAYSLRIYFDFSGYTDIAIGLARVLGVRLPENFSSPYLKPNLTLFWNSWHMTLTQWFRSYLFNPLTRVLRTNAVISPMVVIFITQVITMVTIGLWHGITVNYVYWGLWHGIGLFLQNRWSSFLRGRTTPDQVTRPIQHRLDFIGVFLTFNYVSLGWLFFMLPTPQLAWQTMMKLFGVPV